LPWHRSCEKNLGHSFPLSLFLFMSGGVLDLSAWVQPRSSPTGGHRRKGRLPRLPAPRIAPAMEAGYHHNPMLLHLEEYAIREAPHSRPPTTSVDHGELQGGCLRLPQPWPRPLARNAPQARGECCHTKTALPANPHSPLASRRPGVSRFLKQTSPDLLPRDDIGRVLLVPSDAVIKLHPLRIRE